MSAHRHDPYQPYRHNISQRQAQGLMRTVQVPSPDVHDFANNDYLDLSQHPDIIAAGQSALAQYGTSSSASPLITGYTPAHQALNNTLQQWYQMPHSLLWNSGYAANQALLSTLPQKGDLILADRLIHHSMIQGILHSPARFMRYRHNDTEHLHDLLKQQHSQHPRIFLVTESIFSMDGDAPDLCAIAALKEQYPFTWLLDEAHAIGWYGSSISPGAGLAAQAKILPQVDILVGTLGKSLASHGAYTLFQEQILAQYLTQHAGDFIYSTYLPPSHAAIASASILWIQNNVDTKALQQEATHFRQQAQELNILPPSPSTPDSSPIVPIPIGDNEPTLAIAQALLKQHFRVGAIRPPTVPEGSARLRISLKAHDPKGQQQALLHCLASLLHA